MTIACASAPIMREMRRRLGGRSALSGEADAAADAADAAIVAVGVARSGPFSRVFWGMA